MTQYLNLVPLDVLVLSITTFFAVIGPVDVAVVFAAISGKLTPVQKKHTAIRSTLIAMGILLIFCFFGQAVLTNFGISTHALRISGGILLLLLSINMIYAESSSANSTTKDEVEEALHKDDISVFPLAVPLIAGPAAMGTCVLLMAQYHGNIAEQSAVIAGMLIVLLITFALMSVARKLQKFLGITGINVIQRVFGVLLSALAVQFILDGLMKSQIFL